MTLSLLRDRDHADSWLSGFVSSVLVLLGTCGVGSSTAILEQNERT
jgi:hypothetical protein